jgi:hypothetical protein
MHNKTSFWLLDSEDPSLLSSRAIPFVQTCYDQAWSVAWDSDIRQWVARGRMILRQTWALDAPFKGRSLAAISMTFWHCNCTQDASIKVPFSFSNFQIRYWSLSTEKKIRYWCQCDIWCSNYEHAHVTALGSLQKMCLETHNFKFPKTSFSEPFFLEKPKTETNRTYE